MYDRHVTSLRSVGRMVREENRAVLLGAAGQVCGHLSTAAVAAAVLLGAQGRKLRTAADQVVLPGPSPAGLRELAPPPVDMDARARSMFNHPSNFRRRSGL